MSFAAAPARKPKILIPYDPREAIGLAEAARIAGKSSETVRRWAALQDIGRRIGGQWAISKPALLMLLDDDEEALAGYLAGDRTGPAVASYFARAGLTHAPEIRLNALTP